MLVKSPLPLAGVLLCGGLIAVLTAGGMDGGRDARRGTTPNAGTAIDKKSSEAMRAMRVRCDTRMRASKWWVRCRPHR